MKDQDRQAMILRLPQGDRDREIKIFRLLNERPRQTGNGPKTIPRGQRQRDEILKLLNETLR